MRLVHQRLIKILLLTLVLLLSSLHSSNVNGLSSEEDQMDPKRENQKNIKSEIVVDVAIKGEVYLSKSQPKAGDRVDIYVVINNLGTRISEVKILFTVTNDGSDRIYESSPYQIDPNGEKYGKISWIAQSGSNEITAEAITIGQTDENTTNNIKSTIVNVENSEETDFGIYTSNITIEKSNANSNYLIRGEVDNFGLFDGSLKLVVRDITNGFSQQLTTIQLDIESKTSQGFSVYFTPSESIHQLEFYLKSFTVPDVDDTNNQVIKEFRFDQPSIDVQISDQSNESTVYEVVPGDSKSINLSVTSSTITGEFQVIVGGITEDIKVTPDQWIISLIAGEEQILGVDVSVKETMTNIGEYTIEVLLYRKSNPNDIIEKSIGIDIVDVYSNDSSSFSTESSFIQSPSMISLDEFNPPVIENITHTPGFPTYAENVTVTADITDDSTISNVSLFYSFDDGTSWSNISMSSGAGDLWSALLETPGYGTNVTYYINAKDNFTNSINSSQFSFYFDGEAPFINSVSSPGIVSSQQSATIFANITDNVAIDSSSVFLYYSYDNSSFFMLQMSQVNGTSSSAFYNVNIPSTTSPTVYYYVEAFDLSSLVNVSTVLTYQTDDRPTISSVIHDPIYPRSNSSTTIYANISDDFGISNATLYYSYANSSGMITLVESMGIYSGIIPATVNDTIVYYNISTYDSFGHNFWSSTYSFYSDGLLPSVTNITIDDISPNYQQEVNVTALVQDTNELRNVTLYYSFDGGSSWNPINMTNSPSTPTVTADALVVYSSTQNRGYITRNGYTYDTMTAAAFASVAPSTLKQYRIIILEPNWSNYNNLRSGLAIVDQVLDDTNLVVSIRVAGNGGSQLDIDFLGTDYDRTATSNSETILDASHPFISGAPWSGNQLTSSNFASWGSTDHGWFYNLPTTQSGYTEILQNSNGVSMFEYTYKGAQVMIDTLTSIDGNWGSGDSPTADNYINYLNYTYWQLSHPSPTEYTASIPAAPVDTNVQYYVNATDMANNSRISPTYSYFSDGTVPTFANITQLTWISEVDSVTINATVIDNYALSNNSVYLIYTYDNITYYQTSMSVLSSNTTYGIFQSTIPATSQAEVFYYIEATDQSGLTTQSINSSYLVDLQPQVVSSTEIPIYPHANFSTTINATISDDYGITSVVLYHSYNGTWSQITMNLVDGIYQAVVPAINLNTTVNYKIETTDSYGHVVNSTTYSFYSDGIRPVVSSIVLNPTQPNSNTSTLVRAQIDDLSGIQNSTLHYSSDGGTSWTNLTMVFNSGYWEAIIPALNASLTIDYFVSTFDNTGHKGNSSTFNFQTDTENPNLFNITQVLFVSELQGITINATITDNLGIDSSNVLIYYSYDNNTWFSTSMTNITGTSLSGIYQAVIPSTSQNMVYYYLNATDLSNRFNISKVYNYTIDHTPSVLIDRIDPLNPNASSDVGVYTNVTDDFGISEADLYYSHNSTWYQVSMSNITTQFYGVITALGVDATVSYYVSIVDTFGHRINSSSLNYYVDGISPTIQNIEFTPTNPTGSDNITVTMDLNDNQNIANTTLYYNMNGTWIGVNVTDSAPETITGRDPTTGYYYGSTTTTDYNSGPLSRLSVYTYSSDSDTMSVTLSGYRIDTGTWEQFYSSTTLGTGYIPEFNWADPIYEQWRIQIYDSEYNDNYYYSYEYDTDIGYQAIIPATNSSASVEFYVETFDIAGNTATSSSYFFSTDIDPPSITAISNPGLTSELSAVTINATVDDIIGTNTSEVVLYYSYDNTTFFSTQMTLVSGDNLSGIYSGLIPATNNSIVYYYVNATDLSGLTRQSSFFEYSINYIPQVNGVVLNPQYPNPSTSTDVDANITDDDTITTVKLNYLFNGVRRRLYENK